MKTPPPPDKVYEIEAQFVADVLLHFGARDWLWLWRENTGVAYGAGVVRKAIGALVSKSLPLPQRLGLALNALRSSRPIVFGIPGRADLAGIIRLKDHYGRPLAIECKHENGRRSKEQIQWANQFIAFGGVYILAQQISDIYKGLDEAGYGDLL